MNLHLDLTLTDEQAKTLQAAAVQRGLPVETLVQRAVERFLNEEIVATPYTALLDFAHTIDFDTAQADAVNRDLDARGFTYPDPVELMAMSEADRGVLMKLSALLMEEAYLNDPDLRVEAYDGILDYDDYITDDVDHS
jgi:hypothetical protein